MMLTQNDKLPDFSNVLIRRYRVEELTGLKRSSLYSLMQVGLFPRPVKLSARAVAWPKAAVDDWIARRITAAEQCSKLSGSR